MHANIFLCSVAMLNTESDLQHFSRQQKGRENLYTVKDLMKYFCNFIVIYVCAEIVSVYSDRNIKSLPTSVICR